MNKSEKCYYAIIENKKRGKFSGAGPIQVAKKVASKKLKAGKEMEFYLDEVSGKKKSLGPYQARKDKKSGRVVVVKGRKVMRGGLLSESDKVKLKQFFNNFNNNGIGSQYTNKPEMFVKAKLPVIPFGREPIVYFYPDGFQNIIYKFAVFKERIGNIYIMIYKSSTNIDIVSMTDFFLNPDYSSNFNPVGNGRFGLNKRVILTSLQDSNIIELRPILEEARRIFELLYTQTANKSTQKAIIYVPNYYQPRKMKCVYSNLTFGVLDKETVNQRIKQEMIQSEVPESFYQLYLIKQQSFFNGYYEPVIYIQLPLPNKEKLEKQKLSRQSQINPYFNYCIYTDPTDRNRLKVIIYNPQSNYYKLLILDFNENVSNGDINIKIACSILLTIPEEFGELKRVRRIADSIINPQQFVESQGHTLRQPLLLQQ
jgi:hypothetical protein